MSEPSFKKSPREKFPPCPKCGRKGLHHPTHPHNPKQKEFYKAECRFCKARFINAKFQEQESK